MVFTSKMNSLKKQTNKNQSNKNKKQFKIIHLLKTILKLTITCLNFKLLCFLCIIVPTYMYMHIYLCRFPFMLRECDKLGCQLAIYCKVSFSFYALRTNKIFELRFLQFEKNLSLQKIVLNRKLILSWTVN